MRGRPATRGSALRGAAYFGSGTKLLGMPASAEARTTLSTARSSAELCATDVSYGANSAGHFLDGVARDLRVAGDETLVDSHRAGEIGGTARSSAGFRGGSDVSGPPRALGCPQHLGDHRNRDMQTVNEL
jgi:hypothetical protein